MTTERKRISWEAWVALAIAVIGGAISYGRLSAQVDELKQNQIETRKDVTSIKVDVAEIKGALRNTTHTRTASTTAADN